MPTGCGSTPNADQVLQQWRQAAADLLLALLAFASLPVLIIWLAAPSLPEPRSVRLAVAVLYLSTLAAAVARRWPLGVRVWLMLAPLYGISLIGLVWHNGGAARAWLMGCPIVALVLLGPRAARFAALLSGGAVLVHGLAVVLGAWSPGRAPAVQPASTGFVVVQTFGWLGFFVPMGLLLERFHRFQTRTLAAERVTSARLAGEMARRQEANDLLVRAAAERERLVREIARVGDEERRRLGQDLHDGLSQQLAGALLRSTALEERLATTDPAASADAQALGLLLEDALDAAQDIARGLCPVEMAPEELGPALRALVRRAREHLGVACVFEQDGEVSLPDSERTLHLYRIAQEAVANAVKHAQAHRIQVTLSGDREQLVLAVVDDGCGLSAPNSSAGLGLRIMAYRAHLIGGRLTVEGVADGGTRVACRVPRGELDAA